MNTADYTTIEDIRYYHGTSLHDYKVLPAGSFVRPIEVQYVPKHVLDKTQYRSFNKDVQVFCYCKYGIIPIDKSKFREV